MTGSPAEPRAGKCYRLVASTADLLHHQGVLATTLAHVAHSQIMTSQDRHIEKWLDSVT